MLQLSSLSAPETEFKVSQESLAEEKASLSTVDLLVYRLLFDENIVPVGLKNIVMGSTVVSLPSPSVNVTWLNLV